MLWVKIEFGVRVKGLFGMVKIGWLDNTFTFTQVYESAHKYKDVCARACVGSKKSTCTLISGRLRNS